MRKIYDVLNAILLALTTYTVLSRYAALPGRVPVHFGISGTPDRWGSKSEFLVLVAVSWGLTILFYAFTLAVPRLARNPQYLNIPRKDEFLKLRPEKQAPFWDFLQEFMAGLAVSVNLIFYLIIQGILRVVDGRTAALPTRNMFAGLAVLVLLIVLYLPRMFSLPKKLIRGDEF
ncbi:MAG: DUF1648 domain-containing protein [Candidatus Aminicenantales bacterium]